MSHPSDDVARTWILLEDSDQAEQGAESPGALTELPERYADLGLLGSGGMGGEVRRVHDRLLNRSAAMKLVASPRCSMRE